MKLIQTKDYLLLIDEESEIKENTWYENKGILFLSDYKYTEGNNPNNSNPRVTDFNNSVIAYYPLTKEAKELDLPLLPPFEEVDVEKLANEWFLINNYNKEDFIHSYRVPNYITTKNLFIEGYKAAQSKQFTLEDLKKAIAFAFNAGRRLERKAVSPDFSFEIYREELIQSLSNQQLPSEFFPEFDIVHTDHAPNGFEKVLKFKTNSEDKEELVGTYKY